MTPSNLQERERVKGWDRDRFFLFFSFSFTMQGFEVDNFRLSLLWRLFSWRARRRKQRHCWPYIKTSTKDRLGSSAPSMTPFSACDLLLYCRACRPFHGPLNRVQALEVWLEILPSSQVVWILHHVFTPCPQWQHRGGTSSQTQNLPHRHIYFLYNIPLKPKLSACEIGAAAGFSNSGVCGF